MAPAVLALLAPLPACSAIGDPGGIAEGYPHGGTGQFRKLDADEVGITGGRAIVLQNIALDAAMVAEGHLFYAAAARVDEPPEPPEGFPANEVFRDAFGPRTIFRAAPQEALGFRAGPEVLAASEPWEGEEVFDPWVVVDGDVVRMYYAAEGGIGVAVASAIDGAFARAGGPILDESAALSGAPRRPSVVRGADGAWWMYYDAGGAIGAARSEDGLVFARMDGDPSTPAIDPILIEGDDGRDSEELSVGSPAAVGVDMVSGRRLVRIYFESRRDDGTILPYVAGTEDGVTFERHEVPVMSDTDVRFPAPVLLDARVTLLYVNAPFRAGGYQVRSLLAAVSPAGERFAPDQEE